MLNKRKMVRPTWTYQSRSRAGPQVTTDNSSQLQKVTDGYAEPVTGRIPPTDALLNHLPECSSLSDLSR